MYLRPHNIENAASFDIPTGIYLLKVNNRNIATKCEIYLKLTIRHKNDVNWRRSGVFIVNLEHISHLFLVCLLLFEQVYPHWDGAHCDIELVVPSTMELIVACLQLLTNVTAGRVITWKVCKNEVFFLFSGKI